MAGMPIINGYLGPWNPVVLTASPNTVSQWVVKLFREDFRVPKCKYRLNLIKAVPDRPNQAPVILRFQ